MRNLEQGGCTLPKIGYVYEHNCLVPIVKRQVDQPSQRTKRVTPSRRMGFKRATQIALVLPL